MTQIANQYAQALYALANDEGIAEIVMEQLETLDQAFSEEPDYLRLLSAPNLPRQERCAILDDAFRAKVHLYVLNFLKLLTEKGYIRHFPQCCKCYREQYRHERGIISVCAVTAVQMRPDQKQKLEEKLTKLTGKTVALQNRVDPRCLGGVRLDYDGKRVDGTVKNSLDRIGAMLKNTVL